jgi:hypothetical protein
VPIVVENDDAEPSVPPMLTDDGTDRASDPAVSVAVTVVSPQAPPVGGEHANAGGATTSAVTAAAIAQPARTSSAGDIDLSIGTAPA